MEISYGGVQKHEDERFPSDKKKSSHHKNEIFSKVCSICF